jgi:hypothetical protein
MSPSGRSTITGHLTLALGILRFSSPISDYLSTTYRTDLPSASRYRIVGGDTLVSLFHYCKPNAKKAEPKLRMVFEKRIALLIIP